MKDFYIENIESLLSQCNEDTLELIYKLLLSEC